MEFQYCFTKLLTLYVTIMLPLLSFAYATNGPCDFPAIFNFGDSNSDTGGLSAAFGQAPPPNGETYFHRPAGRYSDGRLIIDFIAESLGMPYLNAYLDALGSNFSHGANFATAGSTIRPQVFNPFSLNVQFSQFNEFQRRSPVIRNQGGVFKGLLPKSDDFSRALYTFDIGQNDLAGGYLLNMTTDQVRAYVPNVVDQFKTIIKNVYDHGGRSFWIHNSGPVGCYPYIIDLMSVTATTQVDNFGCAAPYNEVAQYFNLRLHEVIVQLRKDLPLAAFTYVDVYSVKYELITQAKKHGFVHPLQACCGHGGKYNFDKHFGCGSKIKVKGKEIRVGSCNDPSVAINWDGAHFTQAGNKWVFDQIVNGAYSDPQIPLSKACHRH